MNRLSMASEIAERLPTLRKRGEDHVADAEELRLHFVGDYPVSRIPRLTLDEYVIGNGKKSHSFCYRLEREMDSLGRILGARADKFGVYYGKIKSDPAQIYRHAQHWGANYTEAFAAVKRAIVSLLESAAADNRDAIRRNLLSPMFKGKLLHVYYPNRYAPVYSEDHLRHFVSALDLPGTFKSETDMQRALMEYRDTWDDLRSQSPVLFMIFLYDLFGYPPDKEAISAGASISPTLGEAINGATYINALPPGPAAAAAGRRGLGMPDYDGLAKRRKRIGDRGEAIVLAMERNRLRAAGKPELAGRVKHVAQEDDRAGYDILSFDANGAERPIEVKATARPDMSQGFFLSANELEQSGDLPNYHIYLVFSAMSAAPRVLPVRKPDLMGAGYVTTPVVYHVTPQ